MSIFTPPYDDNLDIGILSKVFERKRVSNCYKYFWFQAILEKLSEKKTIFTYDEILNQMIEDAWYMVTEYNLRLGPCNTTDNLEEVVKYIYSITNISSTAKSGTIVEYLKNNDDLKIKKYKRDLIVNVPYCMQSPFYSSIKGPTQAKVDEINRQKHLLYYFVSLKGTETKFEINVEWIEYLWRNKDILLAWIKYNLVDYLQDRNPSVPGILDKITKPEKRNLKRVSEYWKIIIEIDPSIQEIYDKNLMKDEAISVDHFVPWQFVAHDELWNLSPTTKSINSSKGNQLPNFDLFKELSLLEFRAYELCSKYAKAREKFKICLKYHVNSAEVKNSLYKSGLDYPRFNERLLNIIQPVYNSAKMCGFTEWIN